MTVPSKRSRMPPIVMAALGCSWLLWPGDAPWIFDEPRFFKKALEGGWPSFGLPGTRGLDMGPFAVWFYSFVLSFTHDLQSIVLMRAFLFAACAVASLLWLSRSCRSLDSSFAPIALASTYLWFYSRILWDTFYFPLAALAIAAYVSFCVRGKTWELLLAALCSALLLLTHLMGLVVVVPIAAHAIFFQKPWFSRRRALVAAVAAGAVALAGPYAYHLLTTPAHPVDRASYSAWRGWLFPFFGCRLFSAHGLEFFFDEHWSGGALGSATYAAYPLYWAGIFLSARNARSATNAGDCVMARLALVCLALQSVVFGLMRTYDYPHYLGPGWLISFYFIWLSLSEARARWGRWAALGGAVYGTALALVLIGSIVMIHEERGNRGIHYGATLSNQIELARELNHYHPGPIDLEVVQYGIGTDSLAAIMELYGFKVDPDAPRKRLSVVYAEPAGGRIKLAISEPR